MPMPWRKAAKVSRISRLVADLHPPKPGNSLVVETGFPTSLVDLFVKNRDRLKKPINKKKKKKKQQQQSVVDEDQEDLVISDPISLPNARDLIPMVPLCFDNNKFEASLPPPQPPQENKPVAVRDDRKEEILVGKDGNCEFNQGSKGLVIPVLKMFVVVVVLSLSTKWIAGGITMSAFVLIFLEYIEKWVLPSSKLLIQRGFSICSSFRVMKDLLLLVLKLAKKGVIGDSGRVLDRCDVGAILESDPTIQAVEVKGVEANGRVGNQTVLDLLNSDTRRGFFEGEEDGGGKEHSNSQKIRTKIIKKLKKFRCMQKGRKGKEREAGMTVEASSCCEDEEQDSLDLGGKSKLTLWQLLEEEKQEQEETDKNRTQEKIEFQDTYNRKQGKEEFENKISICGMKLQTKGEMVVVAERIDAERGGNSGYLIIFLIVLAGLVCGRMLALVITIAYCSMLKLVWRRRKLHK